MSGGVRVHYDRGTTVFVTGDKAEVRRRLAVCGDPSPIWVKRRDAWATSVSVAARLLDQLEGRNVSVPIEDVQQVEFDLTETVPANHDLTPEGLW